MSATFSTIFSAVKPKERTDLYVILAALYSLNVLTTSVTQKEIKALLKLHLGNKVPHSINAALRKYTSYVEPAEPGTPLRWRLKLDGVAKLRAMSDLALAATPTDAAFESSVQRRTCCVK